MIPTQKRTRNFRLSYIPAFVFLMFVSIGFTASPAKAIDPNAPNTPETVSHGLSSILEIANQQNQSDTRIKWWLKVSSVNETEIQGPFTIEPALGKNSELVAHLKFPASSLQNPVAMAQILNQLQAFRSIERFENTHFSDMRHWAEIYWNAKAGDLEAQLELKRFELESLNITEKQAKEIITKTKIPLEPSALVAEMKEAAKEVEVEIDGLTKAVRQQKSTAEKIWKEGESSRKTWEKAEEKLDDLLKKSDRKGVRALVESYLPWESMGATEKTAWKQWLDALENPSPNPEDKVILFRGLDDENRLFFSEDGKPGFMSPMLVRNQGNYTWRMRSYRAKREKFGSMEGMFPSGVGTENKKGSSYASLMASMRFHSNDPMGTPFLSLSDFATATRFSEDGMIAVEIDKRRLLPNTISTYPEAEKLIPLLIFPEEVKHHKQFGPLDSRADMLKVFREELEQKLGRGLSTSEVGERVSTNSAITKFRDQTLEVFVKDYIEPNVKVERLTDPIEKYDLKKPNSILGKIFSSCKNFFASLGG